MIVTMDSDSIKYGAFSIRGGMGYWNGDDRVCVKMEESLSDSCHMEGVWNPDEREIKNSCFTAMSGLCIWSKYDCVFKFKPQGKGNPGAVRSLSNPKDRADLFKRG